MSRGEPMRITIIISSIILLFVGFETLNIGGLISPFFIYGKYLFGLIHIFIIIGLYKNMGFAQKVYFVENLFFIVLVTYYMVVIPQLNFGPSHTNEVKPIIDDYLRSLRYGIIPLIFFTVNIIVIYLWSKKEFKKENT